MDTNQIEEKLKDKVNNQIDEFADSLIKQITHLRKTEKINEHVHYKIRKGNDECSFMKDTDLFHCLRQMLREAFGEKMLKNRVDELLKKMEIL